MSNYVQKYNKIQWDSQTYRKWLRNLPLNAKWIQFVIISFPFFATSWDMTGSVVSPLQMLGVSVFGFGIMSLLLKKRMAPRVPLSLNILIFLLSINLFFVFLSFPTFSQFGDTIRTLLPFVLFFYFRKYLNTIWDLEGFMISFLIASVFPVVTLFYEILFDPIREVYNTESRGGGLRLSGFYADLFGYMSHLICGFIAYCYFYLKKIEEPKKHFIFNNLGFILVLLILLTGIYNLRHQASWAVSIFLILLFIHFIRKKVTFLKFMVFFGVLIGVSIYFYYEVFEVLYAKDLNVIRGDAMESAALNGRVWIWQKYFAYWENFSGFSQWFGVGFEMHEKSVIMMGGGMHNDFVRLFFSTGIVGILAYLFFLISLVFRALRGLSQEMRFIFIASILTLVLYSISALPLLASGAMMYFLLAIISQINKPNM